MASKIEKAPFDNLREGFRHYILGWKDQNIKEFNNEFKGKGLRDLTYSELFFLAGKINKADMRCLIVKL